MMALQPRADPHFPTYWQNMAACSQMIFSLSLCPSVIFVEPFILGFFFLFCPNKQPWLSIHHHNKRAVQPGCCSPSITNIAYTAVSIIRYAEKIYRTNAPCRESREIHVGLVHCGSLYLLIFFRRPDICICAVLPAIGTYCTTSKHYRPGRPFGGAHWSFSVRFKPLLATSENTASVF